MPTTGGPSKVLHVEDDADFAELTANPWYEYLRSHAFFNDFYMTDVIKYRANQKDITSSSIRESFEDFLKPELEHVEPELIFSFGGRAWNTVRDELRVESVADENLEVSKISDVHGYLFRTGRILDTYVLPLGHMSTQYFGAQISKDEYIRRLEDGLSQWARQPEGSSAGQ